MEIKGGSVGSRNNLSRLYSFKTTCLPSARPPAEPQRAERRLWKRLYAGDLWFKCLSRCHSQIIMRPHTDFGLNKETKKNFKWWNTLQEETERWQTSNPTFIWATSILWEETSRNIPNLLLLFAKSRRGVSPLFLKPVTAAASHLTSSYLRPFVGIKWRHISCDAANKTIALSDVIYTLEMPDN